MSNPVLIYIGTGIVAVAKDPNSHTIEVYPQELIADTNGNVIDSTDIGGLSQSDLITAEFRFTDAYLTNSPMVVEGDVVTLLEHSDTNVVYWEPHVKSLIRKVTKIRHSYPSKERVDVNDADDNNYVLNLDTEEGILQFTTTKDRKEPVAYDIGLSFKDGKFVFKVDNDDILEWDNVSRKLSLVTKDVEIVASTVYIKGETTVDGNMTVTGNLKVEKSIGATGNISSKSSMRAAQTMGAKIGKFPNLD